MERKWIMMIVMALLCGNAAAQPVGPVRGQYFVPFGLPDSRHPLDPDGPSGEKPMFDRETRVWGAGIEYGTFSLEVPMGWLTAGEEAEVDASILSAVLNYGPPSWKAFLKLSALQAGLEDVPSTTTPSLLEGEEGNGFGIGGGVRGDIFQRKWFGAGWIFQASYLQSDLGSESGQLGRITTSIEGEWSSWAIEAGVGASVNLVESGRIFAYASLLLSLRGNEVEFQENMYGHLFSTRDEQTDFSLRPGIGIAGAITYRLSVWGEFQPDVDDSAGYALGAAYQLGGKD